MVFSSSSWYALEAHNGHNAGNHVTHYPVTTLFGEQLPNSSPAVRNYILTFPQSQSIDDIFWPTN
jgi:hypothetical protein